MSFEKLNLIEPILRALTNEGYSKPTPIQEQAIPTLLERKDLLGCAQTGTGKTAAFAIPILQILHQDELFVKGPAGIKALILTPTRELAIQIGESFAAYGKHLRLRHYRHFWWCLSTAANGCATLRRRYFNCHSRSFVGSDGSAFR